MIDADAPSERFSADAQLVQAIGPTIDSGRMPTPRPACASPSDGRPVRGLVADVADEPFAIEREIDDLPAAAVLSHQNQRMSGELAQRHAAFLRERVTKATRPRTAGPCMQHVARQLAIAVRLAADAEIDLPASDHRRYR